MFSAFFKPFPADAAVKSASVATHFEVVTSPGLRTPGGKSSRRALRLLGASGLLGSVGFAQSGSAVPLPKLASQAVAIRVLYLLNPRMPRMDRAQLDLLLASIQSTTQAHFGVKLAFGAIE